MECLWHRKQFDASKLESLLTVGRILFWEWGVNELRLESPSCSVFNVIEEVSVMAYHPCTDFSLDARVVTSALFQVSQSI